MNTVIVASKNPVKINAVKLGFEQIFKQSFNVVGFSVPSGVSNQPKTDEETLRGAINRAENAFRSNKNADFWVGIEGGIEEVKEGSVTVFAWIVIKSKTRIGKAKTGTFYLPYRIVKYIKSGMELGEADDIVFGKVNSKQKNGVTGILTHDVVTRTDYYVQAVALALIPFINPELY